MIFTEFFVIITSIIFGLGFGISFVKERNEKQKKQEKIFNELLNILKHNDYDAIRNFLVLYEDVIPHKLKQRIEARLTEIYIENDDLRKKI